MTVAWTTKVEELGLAIVPFDQRTKAKELFAEAGKKRNGYVTIKMTLPTRWGTDQQNRAFHALLGAAGAGGSPRHANQACRYAARRLNSLAA